MSLGKVSDESISAFQDLKKHRSGYVIYKIEQKSTIVVHKKSTTSYHEDLFAEFARSKCCYAAYFFNYDDGQKAGSKLFLICWTPESIGMKEPMIYTTLADTLRKSLDGYEVFVRISEADAPFLGYFMSHV